jgi:hypothetical protein
MSKKPKKADFAIAQWLAKEIKTTVALNGEGRPVLRITVPDAVTLTNLPPGSRIVASDETPRKLH